jgi:hypothetical protein
MRGQGRMTKVKGGMQCRGHSKGGWYNPAGVLTARLLKIQVWTVLSLLFSHWNCDTLPGIRISDGEVLVPIGKIFCDAFCEGIEQAAKEDVVGCVRHDLYLQIDIDVAEGEPNVSEVAMHFSDGQVGGFHLQCSFYL